MTPIKQAIWDTITKAELNRPGNYVNSYKLTDEIYAAVLAAERPNWMKLADKLEASFATGWSGDAVAADSDTVQEVADALRASIPSDFAIIWDALQRARTDVNAIVLSTHSVSFAADLKMIDAAIALMEGKVT